MEINTEELNSIVNQFVQAYKDNIKKEDAIASGDLYNLTEGYVELNGNKLRVILNIPEEWKYVEYGRKPGKMPPIEAIESWLSIKGLPRSTYGLKKSKSGKLPTELQLAYVVARSIGKNGIDARPILQNTIDKFGLERKLINAIAQQMINNIVKDTFEE